MYNDTSGFEYIAVIGSGDAAAAPGACKIMHQISGTDCIPGNNYGCYAGNNSMWVDQGCRGIFSCNSAQNVDCESNDEKFTVCPCVPGPAMPGMVFARPTSDGQVHCKRKREEEENEKGKK